MTLLEITSRLKKLKSAAIFCHMRPDGDTIGAAMGLKSLLELHGCSASVVCESQIPSKFLFLPGIETITSTPDENAEAYIAVDCSDPHRLGALSDIFERAKKPKFNIDHHISNTRYGDFFLIEDRAATCEIITEMTDEFGRLTPLTANYLLMGLSSDTGNFAHKNVTASTFQAAAKLVSCGGDIHLVQYHMFKKQSAERAKLFGRTMEAIRYFVEGRIAFISVSQKQMDACGATSDMTEGFIDFPLSVEGVEVAVCVLETAKNRYKISLRSNGKADVNAVAAVYGGGGHTLASGCMIQGDLEEVIDKLRFTISQHLAD